MIDPLANETNGRLHEAISCKDERILDIGNRMKLCDNKRGRSDEEEDILNVGVMVTMKRRVSRYQEKDFLIGTHSNELDGTVKHDVAPR